MDRADRHTTNGCAHPRIFCSLRLCYVFPSLSLSESLFRYWTPHLRLVGFPAFFLLCVCVCVCVCAKIDAVAFYRESPVVAQRRMHSAVSPLVHTECTQTPRSYAHTHSVSGGGSFRLSCSFCWLPIQSEKWAFGRRPPLLLLLLFLFRVCWIFA